MPEFTVPTTFVAVDMWTAFGRYKFMGKPRDSLDLQIRRMIGAGLRDWRVSSKTPVKEIAKRLNCSTDQVYKVERGERDITAADLAKLAIVFTVPIERLVYGDRPKPVLIPKISFTDVAE